MSNVVENKSPLSANDLRKEVVYMIVWKILLGILRVIERRILGLKKVKKPKGVQEYDGYYFPSKRREKKFSKFETKGEQTG